MRFLAAWRGGGGASATAARRVRGSQLEFEPMIGEDVPALRPCRGARWPSDLACAPAFFGPLVLCALFGPAPPLAVEVAVLAVFAAAVGWAATGPAGLLAVGSAVASLNGFRENGLGVLAVHPRVDVPVTVTLLCAWALAWAVRESSVPRPADRARKSRG